MMTKQKKATSDDAIRAVANSVLGREKQKKNAIRPKNSCHVTYLSPTFSK